MRSFIERTTFDPVPLDVVRLLGRVDSARGLERFYAERDPKRLDRLARQAKVASVVASNAIEDIFVPRDAAAGVLSGERPARERGEHELAGYQAALDDIYQNPVEILSVPRLLRWHRQLLGHLGPSAAGRLKTSENPVVDVGEDGSTAPRFTPVSARETPSTLSELCIRDDEAVERDEYPPLLLIAATVLDFLVIHPFDDGNGRVARLLTTALAERAGYRVGRYVSVEQLVHRRRSGYYQALKASTFGWHENSHSIWPWVTYLAEIMEQAYREFERLATSSPSPAKERDRVRSWVENDAPETFALRVVVEAFPDASPSLIRDVLVGLREAGKIASSGHGRGARWHLLGLSSAEDG